MKTLCRWFADRMREPSSWASLAVILSCFGYTIGTDCAEATGLCLSSELWNHIVDAGTAFFGLIAFVMKEAKTGGG